MIRIEREANGQNAAIAEVRFYKLPSFNNTTLLFGLKTTPYYISYWLDL